MRYTVHAIKWDGGWELHIDGEGVTQVRTLDRARQQVADYLETMHDGLDAGDVEIEVIPDLEGLEKIIIETRHEIAEAAEAQRRAADHQRELVRRLRAEGISVTDVAAMLGVTRGRISQLS